MKRQKKRRFKVLFFLTIIVVTFSLTINYLDKSNFVISNEEFLRMVLEEETIYRKTNFVEKFFQKIKVFSSNPVKMLDFNTALVKNDKDEDDEPTKDSVYIKDPYPKKDYSKPTIYIYNTHQLEEYSTSNVESYNVVPNVMMASYILRERLYDLGHVSLVEENDVNNFLITNNWNYASSYKVTRLLMEDAKEKNPSLKFFIDLHRDSVNRKISTTTINGKNYAKMMFLLGLENENYKANLEVIEAIETLLLERYPTISRGIYKKEGKGVNGVYNQDFDKYTILVEMGGEENTIDEVLNSITALAEVLDVYIRSNNL